MKKVIIGSKNPIKVASVTHAFHKAFPNEIFDFIGVISQSKVSDQPMSDEETYLGATNRASNARSNHPKADFWVGVEGGISYHKEDMEAMAWIVILSKSQTGKARTGTFVLPKEIQLLVEQGIELGVADDIVFKRNNSKQQNGAVGILTNDLITRSTYYEHATTLALIPFLKPELYT